MALLKSLFRREPPDVYNSISNTYCLSCVCHTGAKDCTQNPAKRFNEYSVVNDEYFTSTIYHAKITLTKTEWTELKADLIREGWNSIEPREEYVSPNLISTEERENITECFSNYRKVYYTVIPKSCKERNVVMIFEDKVVIHLMSVQSVE